MGQLTSQPTITAQDKAIYQLKSQRDNLKQYHKRLNVIIDRQTTLAKQALKEGKPEKAKLYLKLKKQQQSVVNKTYDQLGNLENLIGTIEFKLIEKDVLYGLSQGNDVLKRLNSEMSVDKIDKILDDLEDEKLKVDEVSDMLGSGLSNAEETEVDEEFERMEAELGLGEKKETVPEVKAPEHKVPELPEVPKSELENPTVESSEPQGREQHEPIAA